MVNRHGSINLCLGSVSLPSLVDADGVCKMDMQADNEGNAKTIRLTVREIMMGTYHNSMSLWQTVMMMESGRDACSC